MITWVDLGLVLLVVAAILTTVGGLFASFGASMASSPSPETDAMQRRGCVTAVVAVAIGIGALVKLLA